MRCDEVIRELAVPTDERDSTALAEHLPRCPACAAWAERAAGLDRLWNDTRPPEPSSEVWDALWAHLGQSIDVSTPNVVAASTPFVPSQNGSSSKGEAQPTQPSPRSHSHPRRWVAIAGLIALAQAAAVLLAVGLSWQGFTPSQPPRIAHVTDSTLFPSSSQDEGSPRLKLVSITVPSEGFPTVVDEGRLVVIHADVKPRKVLLPIFSSHTMFVIQAEGPLPRVIDMTPEGKSFGVDDWYLVFGAVEELANSKLAMKE
ncbi:MAG: hypothetical protein ACHRXM_08145 [Isosphaerales bacterium]